MKEIHTEIEILASAERVWQCLIDFGSYPHWNPFIRRINGAVAVGERLEVFIQPSGSRGMTFRPTIIRAEPHRELCWFGRLWLPGLFDGLHSFLIEPLGQHRIRWVQRERFTGLLVPVLAGMLDRDTRREFVR